MTDEEMLKDYPRLKLEYTRLHQDFRRLKTLLTKFYNISKESHHPEIDWIMGKTRELLNSKI